MRKQARLPLRGGATLTHKTWEGEAIGGLSQKHWRIVPALGLSFLVSGCLSVGPVEQGPRDNVLDRAALAGGEVIVAAPQGYCIQKDSLKARKSGGFALLASCEQLTGFVSGYQVEPVVMTVSALPRVGDAPEPSASEIAVALGDRRVLRRLHGDGLTVVQVQDPEALSAESDPLHWRGIMVINGHIVGLALYGAKGSAATGEKGLTQLMWLAERIREESPLRARRVSAQAPLGEAVTLAALPQGAEQPGRRTANGVLRPVARPVDRSGTPATTVSQKETKKKANSILSNIFGRILP